MSFQAARREETQSSCPHPGSLKVHPTRSEQRGDGLRTKQTSLQRDGTTESLSWCEPTVCLALRKKSISLNPHNDLVGSFTAPMTDHQSAGIC